MSTGKNSICILCETEELSSAIEKAVGKLPSVYTTRIEKPLKAVNGKALKLVNTYDALVVDLQTASAEDVETFGKVLGETESSSAVLGLTNGETSLSQARRLNQIGIDVVLPIPFSDNDLTAAVKKLLDARRPPVIRMESAKARGKIIGVGRAAGGVGASTIATNLAVELLDRRGVFKKKAHQTVVLVDLNPQFGSIGLALDLKNERGIGALATDETVPDEVFTDSITERHPLGLDVIAAPLAPIPLDAIEAEQIASLLDVLSIKYDYVVLDLPSVVVSWEEPLINRLDRLYMVSNLSVPALLHTKRMMDFFEHSSSGLDIQIVINRDRKPGMGSHRVKEAIDVLGRKIATWIPDDPQSARNSADVGRPVAEKYPSSRLARSIRHFAAQVRKTEPRAVALAGEA